MNNYQQSSGGILMPVNQQQQKHHGITAAGLISGEVATTADGRDITRGYVDQMALLQPQDSVLARRGGDYKVYEAVYSDPQVKAVLDQRWGRIFSAELEIKPGGKAKKDKMAADMLRENLEGVNAKGIESEYAFAPLPGFDQVSKAMFHGEFFGHSVTEMLYGKDGRHVTIEGMKVRKSRRFAFSPDFRLKLLTSNNPEGEFLPSKKFWVFVNHSDNTDDPYGLGLVHWFYWPVFFKKHGEKFYSMFLEKYGQPTAVGHFQSSVDTAGNETNLNARNKLLGALRAVSTDTGIALPTGMEIKFLEATRSGTADYLSFLKYWQENIAKTGVGQTQTIENVGGSNKAETQQTRLEEIAKASSKAHYSSFERGPATWLTQWNYPGAKTPLISRRLDPETDLKERVDIDKIIFDMGYRPKDAKYIGDTYGGEWERADDLKIEVPEKKQGNVIPISFAEDLGPAAQLTVDSLTQKVSELSQQPIDTLKDNIEQQLLLSDDLNDFAGWLADENKELAIDDLATLMQWGMALAHLKGGDKLTLDDEGGTRE